MDIKSIKQLVAILEDSALNSLEVEDEEGGKKVYIKLIKGSAVASEKPIYSVPIKQEVVFTPNNLGDAASKARPDDIVDFNNVRDIRSPMVGVFYTAQTPESEPFAKKGMKVKKGDTLCIIEAMKLMNEVTSECDGEIVDICVENGSLVEFGQPLFKIF